MLASPKRPKFLCGVASIGGMVGTCRNFPRLNVRAARRSPTLRKEATGHGPFTPQYFQAADCLRRRPGNASAPAEPTQALLYREMDWQSKRGIVRAAPRSVKPTRAGERNSSGAASKRPTSQLPEPRKAAPADAKTGGFFDETARFSVAPTRGGSDYSSPPPPLPPAPSPSPAATVARAEGAAAMMSARSSKPAASAAAAWSIVSSRSTFTLR